MIRLLSILLALTLTIATTTPIQAAADRSAAAPAAKNEAEKPKDQATLEKEFAELLTGATLVGSYNASDAPEPRQDRYSIVRAVKGQGDEWIITAKIEYKGISLPIDLNIPVKWAGDTAVMSPSKLTIPGFGTFTARVMFFEHQYAGTWSSAKHGGQMWGRVERTPTTKPVK